MSGPNEITTNTRNMRAAVDQAVQRLATASPNSINEIVHEIDKQVLQHQYEKVIDPLFGDPSTHQNTYTKAFTSLLNEKLEEQGILPQVLMTFGENKDNFMALASGQKYIRSDALDLAVADYDQSQSYVEALLARDMQGCKSAIERSKRDGVDMGGIRIGGKDGISPERLEAYANAGNDFAGAKAMLSEFGTPAGYNRLSGNKPGAYIDRSDIENMLEQNSSALTPEQLKALQYMEANYDKIAVKGSDRNDPNKLVITHLSMEKYAAKHHVNWDMIRSDQAHKTEEQRLLDVSLTPGWQGQSGGRKHTANDNWSDEFPDH